MNLSLCLRAQEMAVGLADDDGCRDGAWAWRPRGIATLETETDRNSWMHRGCAGRHIWLPR